MLSCTSSPEAELKKTEINVLSVNHSGCTGLKEGLLNSEVETWKVSNADSNVYIIEHTNAPFNCCLPEGIEIKVWLSNDTLYFSDNEKALGNCNCICNYTTKAEVGELTPGGYVLCLLSGGVCKGSVSINVEKNMNVGFTVSELADNQ